MVFGLVRPLVSGTASEVRDFQFPVGIRWCSDYVLPPNPPKTFCETFNSLWELDGVRTGAGAIGWRVPFDFQFPVGIRWCSDLYNLDDATYGLEEDSFQFPVGIRWCSDYLPILLAVTSFCFQFPVGIRWCSDEKKAAAAELEEITFNSLWELDGVRTRNEEKRLRLCF